MITAAEVSARLKDVRARCAAAGNADVAIVGVTKGHGPEAIRAAAGAGLLAVGESYGQELLAKHDALDLATGGQWPRVHFIGHLQRNKVRRIAALVDVWQSVDRPALVDEIAKRSPGTEVMIQVDIADEASKGGCAPEDVSGLVRRATEAGLGVTGLMGIGPLGGPNDARRGFRRLRALVDELGLAECSMGMSGDLEVAIEEGTTMLRIGTDLFGERPRRDARTA